MPPDASSPATSMSNTANTFIPFLSARTRRGSLASISSRKEIDKDVLQQALDDIHTSESKTTGLTSFHDFDGEGRSAAKELVTSGVAGLYNRLRQTVGGGGGAGGSGPVKEGSIYSSHSAGGSASKLRPKSIESRDSLDATSQQSTSPAASRTGVTLQQLSLKKPLLDASSTASLSVPPSPVVRAFASNDPVDAKGTSPASVTTSKPQLHTGDGKPIPSFGPDELRQRPLEHVKPPALRASKAAPQDAPTRDDMDKARKAWMDNDLSELATDALARVLSHHEVSIADHPQQSKDSQLQAELEEAIDDSDYADGPQDALTGPGQGLSRSASRNPDTSDDRGKRRPPMVRVGISHLPGFDPSRASSTTDGDVDSRASSRPPDRRPILEPSPNLNSALQRRRTGVKPLSASTSNLTISTHLRRRILSKEFWMRDDNAKVCFSCGQNFSTFRRKHHCRTCGQIFDAKCTSLVAGKPFGIAGTVRMCKPCESIIFGDDDDSTVFSDDEEYLRSPLAQNLSEADDQATALANFDGPAFNRTDNEATTPSIGIPASRRNREAKRRSAVIEFDTAPALVRPSSSHSLISLSRRPRSSSHRRRHSRHHPTSRLLRTSADAERGPFHQGNHDDVQRRVGLPTFHNDNIIDPDLAAFLSDDGSDDDDRPNIFSAVGGGHAASPGERERFGFGGLFTSASRKGRSRGTDRRTGPSPSVQGMREDEKLTPKLSRHRNLSNVSLQNSGRPSPRRSRSSLLMATVERDGFVLDDKATLPLMMPNSGRAKMVCSSALQHGRPKDDLELYPASYQHVKKLLSQQLNDSKVSNGHAWQKALMPILMQCTDDVEPDVQQGDDMDIRHYIKLKKVPGGRPSDTAYVSGVVFSKNVALKTMARSISDPRILIVGFSIEYARHESHFMSLEPVRHQEREYLNNIVSRIAQLRPTVLLVQKHVSGLALELLDKAGITVAYNIKASVLAAVARMTQTLVVNTLDKLAMDSSRLGYCQSFNVKTYLFDGRRKTYIYLSGCDPDLGCTIVLRGNDTKTLRNVKRIAEFMCYVAYNLKLENYLMRDEFVSIPHTAQSQIEAHDNTHEKQDTINATLANEIENGGVHQFKYESLEKDTRHRILSASPFVVFMQPYLLTQLRDLERRLATYKLLRDQYAAADHAGDEDEHEKVPSKQFSLVEPEMVNAPASKDQPKAVREYLHAVHEAQLENAEHAFQTQERQWESFAAGEINPFDPLSHQKIIVLFSTVSSLTSAPCSGPEMLGIGFYASFNNVENDHDEDITLGQYVQELCLVADSTCRDCNKKMLDHHRQYVHGYGQLSVSIQKQPAKMSGYSDTILMWSTCRICRQETTVTQMSDHTWKYSFAKYLELSFWSSHLHPRAGLCKHDIHKDFLRCFGFQDMVVRMQYDAIDIYDVVVPRARITWKVAADLTVKNQQYSHFEQRLNAFTASIKKRLDSINVDTLDEKLATEANELVDRLRVEADQDHYELMQKLQAKYAMSRYYELIPLNRALRFMEEKAVSWDEKFNQFEQDYFPSETDIRKLAMQQMRHMFLESQPPPSITGSDVDSDAENGTEMTFMGKPQAVSRQGSQDDILSEKAQNVLLSVVEEHKAQTDESALRLVKSNDTQATAIPGNELTELTKLPTPRRELEEAAERDDLKHLDLAVVTQSPPRPSARDGLAADDGSPRLGNAQIVDDTQDSEGTFATQPKPLSSGLLERIEQIRNNRTPTDPEPTESAESKIPRLVDLQQNNRDSTLRPSPPPLLRAQSQPGHPGRAQTRSIDATINQNIDHATDREMLSGRDGPPVDKRISERLGVARLASKIGKVAPSLIPRSVPKKGRENSLGPSTVSALAKHFEQMSREFEKERLKERRQRAMRSRQARANPVASSRPVVEVYQNATDAVGERQVEREGNLDDIARQQMEAEVAMSQPEDNPHSEMEGRSVRSDHEDDARATSIGDTTDLDGEGSDAECLTTSMSRDNSDPTSSLPDTVASSHDLFDLSAELAIPEHRKNMWFKYLTEFWSKRSASGWSSLEYPLHPTEHVFNDSDIIVREDEPSSVIAFALASPDYLVKEREFRDKPNRAPLAKHGHAHTVSQTSNGQGFRDEGQRTDIEASLLSDTGTHMKYSFAHGQVKASCKIFYAESFDALRRRCGVADRFMESMSRCLKFDSKGGKTKSLFLRTLDNRFIIKSLQEVELKAFTKFAPDYFNFMSYTLFHGVPSVIAKMFGLFQVNIRNPATGVDFSYYLLVMENLFYERNPTRRFDLKGSMRNRKIESTGQADEVLLDENLVETIFESPLFVREHSRKLLQASVFNDTLWLCKQNVMDYSLMAGFDDTRKELVVGIIDCIRTYTWDKKLESWIKDRGKNKPTITSPKDYRNRFRVSMMQYVLQAPNCWHQFQAQMAPPKTLKETADGTGTGADETEVERI